MDADREVRVGPPPKSDQWEQSATELEAGSEWPEMSMAIQAGSGRNVGRGKWWWMGSLGSRRAGSGERLVENSLRSDTRFKFAAVTHPWRSIHRITTRVEFPRAAGDATPGS